MYSQIAQLISQNLRDNDEELITPEKLREVFTQAVADLGSGANLMGIAYPATDLVTVPDNKQWYFTDGRQYGTYTLATNGTTVTRTVNPGDIWLFYAIDGTGWHAALLFKGLGYNTRGGLGEVVIDTGRQQPDTPTPIYYPPLTGDIIRMTVDDVEVAVSDHITFEDGNTHRVTLLLSDTYRTETPYQLFRGCTHTSVELPEGIESVQQLEGTIGTLVLPSTLAKITAGALSRSSVTAVRFLGAPPAFFSTTARDELMNVTRIYFPEPYRHLYQRRPDFTAVAKSRQQGQFMQDYENKNLFDVSKAFDTTGNDYLRRDGTFGTPDTNDALVTLEITSGQNNTYTVTDSSLTPTQVQTLVAAGKDVTALATIDSDLDVYLSIALNTSSGVLFTVTQALFAINIVALMGDVANDTWTFGMELVPSVPAPTRADEGKLLSVNSNGEYALVTIVNSENIAY